MYHDGEVVPDVVPLQGLMDKSYSLSGNCTLSSRVLIVHKIYTERFDKDNRKRFREGSSTGGGYNYVVATAPTPPEAVASGSAIE